MLHIYAILLESSPSLLYTFIGNLVTFLSDARCIRYNEPEDVKDVDRINEKMDSRTTE